MPTPPRTSAATSADHMVVTGELDVPVLVSVVAPAVEGFLLRALDAAGHGGIRAVHGYVFQRLLEGPCTVGMLASKLDVTQQRVSTLVEELESLGYVRRVKRADDGRVREVTLTDKGRDAIEAVRHLRADLEAQLGRRVGDLQPVRAALASLLELTSDIAAVEERRVPMPPP